MHFFTSAMANYIPKARILAKTLKAHNPDCFFSLGLSDNLPDGFDLGAEPFDEVIFTDYLPCFRDNNVFFFKHNVTEICTAVKPALALDIINRHNADKVVYLDPDIVVFDAFSEISKLLDRYSMIFTPHQTVPEKERDFIIGNEVLFLKRGIYNLGFFAVKADNTGIEFLKWWHERLKYFCMDDKEYTINNVINKLGLKGLFTDQKWIDMVPAYFDNYYILKKPGYNVSTWNLTRHSLQESNGNYFVDGYPLIFFHFSGFDSKEHHLVLNNVIAYNHFCSDAKKLSNWYEKELTKEGQKELGSIEWKYSRYSNNEIIPNVHRKILNIRIDVHPKFPDPFLVTDGFCFYTWVKDEYGKYLSEEQNETRAAQNKNYKLRVLFNNTINFFFPYNTKRREFARSIKRFLKKIGGDW